ncbi:MAG: zinc ABC transporter substrate-binding protein [Pseudomonadota bacterium]
MRLLATLCLLIFSSSLHAGQLSVFVSVPPLHYLVEMVGGDGVVVESMVSPGHNPVNYDPAPQQLQRFADADVYIRSGIPFELAWMPRLEELNPGMLIVDVRSNLPVSSDDGHQQGGDVHHLDPHVWTSPLNAIAISRRILNALAAVAPRQQEQFRRNQQQLEQQLMALHQSIIEALKPHTGATFLVFHPAWGYFAKSYGLRQMAIEIEGKEPGPKQLAGVIEAARRQQVGFLLVQEQFSGNMAKTVSAELGVELIRTNPLAYDLVGSLQQVAAAIAGSRHE